MTEPDGTRDAPKRTVPSDALSAAEFDQLVAFVATARDGSADPPPAPVPVLDEPLDDEPSRWRWVLVNCVLVVLLGGGIGLAVAALAGRTGSAEPPPAPVQAAPTPVVASPTGGRALPSPSAPASPSEPAGSPANNPRIAPTITLLSVVDSSVVLRWRDATRSEATFIVIRVVQGRGQPVDTVAPGTTEVVLDSLQPAGGPFCFLVIAVVGQQRGVSPIRCSDQGI